MKKTITLLYGISFSVCALNAQWNIQNSSFPNTATGINCISIVDANTVWAAAFDSSYNNPSLDFTMTVNGGTTWTAGTVSGPNANFNISNISGVDASTAFVAVADWNNGGGRIYKTVDGGANWTQQNNGAFILPNGWVDAIHFWNANEGVCLGDSNTGYWEFYTTVDGGTNWSRVPQGNIPANLQLEYGLDNVFSVVGNTIWFATDSGRVYKSIDKGMNWTVASTGLQGITSMAFKDANNGLVEDGGVLMSTTDGGATWNNVNFTGNLRDGWMCYAPPGGNGFYVTTEFFGGQGGSAYSLDNGVTWNDFDDLVDHGAVMFLNSSTGWSGGWNVSPTTDGMFVYAGSVGIKNNSVENAIVSAVPNPFSEATTITVSGYAITQPLQLNIFDLTGKLIRTQSSIDGTFHVNRNELADGSYLYRITSGTVVLSNGKLVVN
ncbi:MAG: T9SS type A sorting domain-containing protein [Bacteroidetes bacterium]|nr:T9SS type A sorting domain-containing protein [Bacteroidota bacterium]